MFLSKWSTELSWENWSFKPIQDKFSRLDVAKGSVWGTLGFASFFVLRSKLSVSRPFWIPFSALRHWNSIPRFYYTEIKCPWGIRFAVRGKSYPSKFLLSRSFWTSSLSDCVSDRGKRQPKCDPCAMERSLEGLLNPNLERTGSVDRSAPSTWA